MKLAFAALPMLRHAHAALPECHTIVGQDYAQRCMDASHCTFNYHSTSCEKTTRLLRGATENTSTATAGL